MRATLNDKELTLYFEGELNSSNAEAVEKDVEKTLKDYSFTSLVFDFSNISYVSSAGLRIILKYKQKHKDLSIVEVNLEVYDVLSMTGIVKLVNVKKAMKRIDVKGLDVVGSGFCSTVYRIDKDTIIKVFERESDTKEIERELNLAKEAFILGIPTAISFDIVRVDNHYGVRFEMLDCDSLRNAFLKHPEQYDELLKKYVELLKKINSTTALDNNLPDLKKIYLNKVELIKPYLEKDKYEKLLHLVQGIEDRETFVHGDCHFKNIMVQGDELLLIDMDTLSKGHPIFELAAIYAPYIAFEEDDKGNNERFLGVKPEFSQKLFNDLIKGYIPGSNEEIIDKIRLVSYAHMVWWNRVNEPENDVRFKGCLGRLNALLETVKDLDIKL